MEVCGVGHMGYLLWVRVRLLQACILDIAALFYLNCCRGSTISCQTWHRQSRFLWLSHFVSWELLGMVVAITFCNHDGFVEDRLACDVGLNIGAFFRQFRHMDGWIRDFSRWRSSAHQRSLAAHVDIRVRPVWLSQWGVDTVTDTSIDWISGAGQVLVRNDGVLPRSLGKLWFQLWHFNY